MVDQMWKEMKEEKETVAMNGQKRKLPMNCSFCGEVVGSILEAFKHYEEKHTLKPTVTSTFFIDNQKLFHYSSPTKLSVECKVIDIATFKTPFICQKDFISFHFIKTNINNTYYNDLLPRFNCSQKMGVYTMQILQNFATKGTTLIAHLGNEHGFFFMFMVSVSKNLS